jgi:hypothetical protein
VEVADKAAKDFEAVMKGVPRAEIGRVTKTPRLVIEGLNRETIVDASLEGLLTSWKRTLSQGV